MNLDVLYTKIKNPTQLNTEDIGLFKDLSDKYPFAQIFTLLYLKSLSNNKDLRFEEELQKNAFKITDRIKLYDIIHNNVVQTSIIEEVEIESVDQDLKSEQDISIDFEAKENELNEIVFSDKLETNTVEENEEISISKNEIDTLSNEEIISDQKDFSLNEDELEKEFLANIISSSYSIEQEVKNSTKDKIEESVNNQSVDLNEKRSFSAWLKISSDSNQEVTKSEKKVEQIINKFIEEEPEKIKVKTDFYSAPKKAKESVKDDNLIYTETLANIYALQGNFTKAITAFEQLIHTSPHKADHFKSKIKEIKGKMNS